jgi:hypothetical protein
MQKPDFGNVNYRIEWTTARVQWVRYLAEDKNMTAREIAADIGLPEDKTPRIFELCKRHDIALTGQGGRPKQDGGDAAVYRIAVTSRHADLLARLARRHSLYPGKVVEMLLNAAFETGEPFCINLLDIDAGA